MLEVRGLRVCYGNIVAVQGLDLSVNKGEVVAIVGPNGAGKTSAMMAISGVLQPRSGEVYFNGENISGLAAHEIYQRGIVQVPEGRLIFGELTVRDNLMLGAYARHNSEQSKSDLEDMVDLFPVLGERLEHMADTLSGGQLQMLAVARGVMGRPELLMLDEPSLGLAPMVVEDLYRSLHTLSSKGLTVLLVEQNVHMALEFADRAYLLEAGVLIEEGRAQELLHSDLMVRSYLGKRTGEHNTSNL